MKKMYYVFAVTENNERLMIDWSTERLMPDREEYMIANLFLENNINNLYPVKIAPNPPRQDATYRSVSAWLMHTWMITPRRLDMPWLGNPIINGFEVWAAPRAINGNILAEDVLKHYPFFPI